MDRLQVTQLQSCPFNKFEFLTHSDDAHFKRRLHAKVKNVAIIGVDLGMGRKEVVQETKVVLTQGI